MRSRRPTQLVLAVLLLLSSSLALVGCKVTADDVEAWKGTVKGPGKIVAVILADKYPDELRTRAALALVEMERQDVDGVQELQRALQRLEPEKRAQIIDGMVTGLEAMMRGSNTAQPSGEEGPSAQQVRAKDAAFLLIAQAPPATRARLTQAVIGWYVQDFNGRSLAGNYSAEQVVRALGAPAASLLVDALNARLPQQALVKLCELIAQLGDAAAKARAAQRLVAMEREMEGDQFVEWIKATARDQLRQNTPGQAIDEARLTTIAALNRENFINDGALPSMKFLTSEAVVVERLLEIAEGRSTDAKITERRKRALMALEGAVGAPHMARLLDLALAAGENNPDAVRDYAFDRVGDIRSPEALPRLWPLVQNATEQRQRWRAAEMLLAIGGGAIVAEFFSKLPTAADTAYAPEELAGYAQRMAQMTPLPAEIVRAQLNSPHWWARVIALRYFERKGTLAEVPLMERLKTDSATCTGPGWETGYTVGKVAESAIAALLDRLGSTPQGGNAPAPH